MQDSSKTSPQAQLQLYQLALQQNPKDLEAQLNCANLCIELQRFEEAAGYFRRLIRVFNNQRNVKTDQFKTSQYCLNALCFSLESLGNHAQNNGNFALAAGCFEEALENQPTCAAYWYNLGNAQRDLAKPQLALESFKKSIKFNALDADTHNNLGNIQRELGQLNQAIASYQAALKINPNLHHALAHLVHQKQHMCDWDNLDVEIAELRRIVREVPAAQISPFAFLAMPNTTAQEQLQCASNWANSMFANLSITASINNASEKSQPASRMVVGLQSISNEATEKTKIKIGYLSADFRLHPLAFLITELIENHDRKQFEVFAYSYGAADNTDTRKRFVKAFDQFNDIKQLTDAQAAQKIQFDNIDILVDLTGYTQSSRTSIVALKPATIHVNWLGYAGSMGELAGKSLFDYMIADAVIAPKQVDFSEQLIYLPCYQPNNSQRPVGQNTNKTDNNLPENAFVFCCFNQSFKINAEVWQVWLSILKQTPNSVLWLLDCNQWAKANLTAALAADGLDVSRLIFAPRVPVDAHLARHKHADLFLDTLPYNAHTTASDALLMNLPVLTCIGNTFASRVASSLLSSVNLPELIANNFNDYQNIALDLCNNNNKINILKDKLKINIKNSFAFNSAIFTKTVETKYTEMLYKTKNLGSL